MVVQCIRTPSGGDVRKVARLQFIHERRVVLEESSISE